MDGELQVVETVAEAERAVVSVIITKDLPVIEQYFERGPSPFGDLGFPDLFAIPRYRQRGTERQEIGGGTAFFVSSDGLLMTNRHVVNDKKADYTILLNDGRKLPAKVVALHPGNDIALLKVEGTDFPSLTIAADQPHLGQTVIAIGNALGEFRNTVSVGVISGLKRSLTAGSGRGTEHLDRIIQTDAAINTGNSGGPLLSLKGEVVGMNTAIAEGAQNISFALPAVDLLQALESYRKNGRIIQAFLGVRYMPITSQVKEENHLSYDYGVLVVRGEKPADLAVIPGSPADKAGIQENDIILEADGQRLEGNVDLATIVRSKSPGDTVTLKISHKGTEKTLTATLEEAE
jgi:serine protease Do